MTGSGGHNVPCFLETPKSGMEPPRRRRREASPRGRPAPGGRIQRATASGRLRTGTTASTRTAGIIEKDTPEGVERAPLHSRPIPIKARDDAIAFAILEGQADHRTCKADRIFAQKPTVAEAITARRRRSASPVAACFKRRLREGRGPKIDLLEAVPVNGGSKRSAWLCNEPLRQAGPVEETMTRCLNAATACFAGSAGEGLVQGPRPSR